MPTLDNICKYLDPTNLSNAEIFKPRFGSVDFLLPLKFCMLCIFPHFKYKNECCFSFFRHIYMKSDWNSCKHFYLWKAGPGSLLLLPTPGFQRGLVSFSCQVSDCKYRNTKYKDREIHRLRNTETVAKTQFMLHALLLQKPTLIALCLQWMLQFGGNIIVTTVVLGVRLSLW